MEAASQQPRPFIPAAGRPPSSGRYMAPGAGARADARTAQLGGPPGGGGGGRLRVPAPRYHNAPLPPGARAR